VPSLAYRAEREEKDTMKVLENLEDPVVARSSGSAPSAALSLIKFVAWLT
jgi:hypothetical protein